MPATMPTTTTTDDDALLAEAIEEKLARLTGWTGTQYTTSYVLNSHNMCAVVVTSLFSDGETRTRKACLGDMYAQLCDALYDESRR